MTRDEVKSAMDKVFAECMKLREAAQKEYAHEESNAFANFEDDARSLKISREAVLSVFANKHWRGIRAYITGHKSQREDVRGRINDMIVYLCLLRGMVDENEFNRNALSRSQECAYGGHEHCKSPDRCPCQCHRPEIHK